MAVAADYTSLVQELYLAYFGRPADVVGLNNMTAAMAAANVPTTTADFVAAYSTNSTVKSLVDSFGSSTESANLYGSGSTAAFVNAIFQNLLNRAPAVDGLLFWVNAIDSGAVTKGAVAMNILAAAVKDGGNATDLASVTNKVTVASNFTTTMSNSAADIVAYTGATAAQTARDLLKGVTATTDTTTIQSSIDSTLGTIVTGSIPVVNATLTTGVDTLVGGSGNDTFNAVLDAAANKDATLTTLDSIDGGAGNNVLNIVDLQNTGTALPTSLTVKNVQTFNLTAAGAANIDTTSANISGLTALNVTAATGATVTSGSEAVTVTNTSGTVTVSGGSTQNVTTAGSVVLSGASGKVTAVDGGQTGNSTIDGGTDVSLTTTAKANNAATGTITIGATSAPSGNVTVVDNLVGVKGAAFANSGGAIDITGGKVISVTENATQAAMTTASTNSTLTQAAVTVHGGSTVTTVTVNQSAPVAAVNTVLAVAGSTETASVQFAALAAGNTVILAGLTLTAPAGGLTAKQVAAAFANLSNAVGTGWTSGAVSGANSDTVVFTSTSALANVADLADTGTGGGNTITVTQGIDHVAATGTGGIASGAVGITGTAVSNVTLSNYANSTINSNALTTLSLSGQVGTLAITNTSATTLDLTVNGLSAQTSNTISNNTYTALKVHTAGTAGSTLSGIADTGATSLTVDGSQALTLTTAAGLTSLKTITVSGSAGLTTTGLAASVTDVNASATTGNMNVVIDATVATYEGGKGNDVVTIAAAPTHAISGGAGVDTLVLNVAAATFSNPSGNTNISGFETLGLGAAATGSYDATGFLHLTEGAVFGGVTYTNVAAGVDLTFTASPTAATTYTLKDATGTSDSLTVALKGSGAIAAGTLTASGIETINLSANDTSSTAVAGGTADSITIVDTAVKTMVITGNTTLTLTNTGNTALTSVDASGMTGGLTYTTAGTVAEVVKGGATANHLTAGTGTTADTLIGGAGNDVLTANAGLDTLTGGAGNDTFVIATPSNNLNSYATITDATAGDVIQLAHLGVETFTSAKITLGGTAVFQDYANAAINAGGDAHTNAYIAWFQFGGDTYIVESLHNATTTHDFQNGTDVIVKLSGVHDLSTAQLLENGTPAPVVVIH